VTVVESNRHPDANLVVVCPHCGRSHDPGLFPAEVCTCGHHPVIRKDRCPCETCEQARTAAGRETLVAEYRRKEAEDTARARDARKAYDAVHGRGSWAAKQDAEFQQFADAFIREMGGDPATYPARRPTPS
jgi:hypothetical protein